MADITMSQYIAILDKLIAEFPTMVATQTEIAGKDILAATEDRVVRTGTDSSGQSFEAYTPAYLKRKQKLGRDVGHVNFQLSGQMLASTDSGLVNIVPSERVSNGPRATIKFDGRDKTTKDKLAGNDKSRPGFLNPSRNEVSDAEGDARVRIEKLIQARFQ